MKMAYLPFELGHLTPEMMQKAKQELGETEETVREALAELRRLLKGETNLVCPLDDNYLKQFLRPRKYNVKRAFSLMLNYYNVKKQRQEVYTPDFAGFRNSVAKKYICVMPYRDDDGALIVVFKLENWNYKERKLSSVMHDISAIVLALVEDPATQVCGLKCIFDMKSLSLNHLRHIHPKYIHLIAVGAKNGLPMRLKAVHVLNESFLFQYVWNILKFVINEKIASRMHFHSSNMESLHEHISPELLPVEYGGKIEYKTDSLLKYVDACRPSYEEMMSYGYRHS